MNTTAKEFLKRYEEASKRVLRLEREYNDECILIDAIRSTSDNDGMPHSSRISKPTEEKAIRLSEKAAKLVSAKLKAVAVRQEVFDVIDSVGGLPGEVLYWRYIKLLRWEEVCVEVHKSWNVTHGYHRDGLQIVEEILSRRGLV